MICSHDEWFLDHFVNAVGIAGDSLVFNTTWGNQEACTERQLRTTTRGFSFQNPYKRYYGIAILGRHDDSASHTRVRLFVTQETPRELSMVVKCEDLDPGREYLIFKSFSRNEGTAQPLGRFRANDTVFAFNDRVSRRQRAIYWCVDDQ